ncbi:SusC/RagA family TonB-linked outer membrane protein [Nonlabens ponticola]|uniref:TonB-dependent receptor n=1 Tax=Nonlabens ponticola TaxID=2496866 RepID=A0A3S9N0J2_9FLAO|nr:TonB-dependent receptor [Nonlabens ponticola]AZQ44909.1 TonB-dependent receptor [Nonlabens ponticola]
MNRFITITFLLLGSLSFAQQTINGTVTDATTGEPLLGATVVVKGTNTAVTTDFDGEFTITANDGAVIVVSYVGYKTKSQTYTGSPLVFNLEQDVAGLDAVVVVGYGTQAVREVTGAVSIVNNETIEELKPTRIEQALQGTVPGVTITSQSGSPGSASNIRIRGIGTNGDSRPLILVDGNVIEDLSVINPNDVESISVLKDATASIYGVRASNGVVIITTKNGRRNQPLKLEYDAYVGFQQTTRKLPTLDALEYALLKNEAFANNGEPIPFPDLTQLSDVDYQDEVFDDAPIFFNNLGIRGGTEKSAYGAGASVLLQDGIVGAEKSKFQRSTFRGNFDHFWLDNLEMKTGVLLNYSNRRAINESGLGSVLFNALNMAPTIPIRDEDGEFSLAEGLGNEVINPIAQIANSFNETNILKVSGNFGLTYSFLNDFELTSRIQTNYSEVSGYSFAPEVFYGSGKVFNVERSVYNTFSNYFRDYTFDSYLNYEHAFAKVHNVQATLGISAFRTTGKFNGFTGFDIPDNDIANASIENAVDVVDNFVNGGDTFDQRLFSQFVRLRYSYDDKYLFTAQARRDGSSNFGPRNKYGFFPSASVGWVPSLEEFMDDEDWIDFLKVRFSYGVAGNDRIPAFAFTSLLNGEGTYPFDDVLVFGTAAGTISNPELKWEEQYVANFGIDANFLDGNLTTSFDVFNRRTEDLLITTSVSGILGAAAPGSGAPVVNGGSVRNRGLEFAIGYNGEITDEFSYGVNYNIGVIDNEVLDVNNTVGFIEGGQFGIGQLPPARMEEGQPLGYFYGLRTDGIFQNAAEVAAHPSQIALGANAQPGDIRFVDVNNDGVIDQDDRVNIGDPIADVTMGLNLSFNYRNFDFQTYLYASIGNDMVRNYERSQNLTNVTTNDLARWTGPGTSNSVPRVTTGATANRIFSDYFVEDASFLRMQNLQLGYTFNDAGARKNIEEVRFYGSVNNLFTLTKYRGFDPSASSGAPIGGGIDPGFYPVPRTFLLGMNVKF